jgi:N-acetylmuramoyl-L-alanine amidase
VRTVLVLAVLLALSRAQAGAAELIVNGSPLAGGVAFSVANTSYVAAEPFARMIGARYSYDAERSLATFQLSGRLAALRVYESVAEAAADGDALYVEGRDVASLGGVLRDGVVYVQVRSLAAAFGGSVTVMPETAAIAVFFPRATLEEVRQPDVAGDYERLVLSFNHDVPLEIERLQDTVYLRFPGSRLAGAARHLQGDRFANGGLYAGPDYVELRFSLHEDSDFEVLELPQPQGVEVVVDIFTASEPVVEERLRVVLDPSGSGTDGALSLTLALELRALLERRGLTVELTREGEAPTPLENRASRGIGADLFVSFGVAPLEPGQLNLYYLDDAATIESLGMAIRHNAQSAMTSEATDGLRRRLLLGLVPDLAFGEVAARHLANTLEGYQAATVAGAPLYVLGGAAGRGMMIELSREDLERQELADALAASLASLLSLSASSSR